MMRPPCFTCRLEICTVTIEDHIGPIRHEDLGQQGRCVIHHGSNRLISRIPARPDNVENLLNWQHRLGRAILQSARRNSYDRDLLRAKIGPESAESEAERTPRSHLQPRIIQASDFRAHCREGFVNVARGGGVNCYVGKIVKGDDSPPEELSLVPYLPHRCAAHGRILRDMVINQRGFALADGPGSRRQILNYQSRKDFREAA